MNGVSRQYDLEERTLTFSTTLVKLCRSLRKDDVPKSVLEQLISSGTSIGANYAEANNASSKKDFRNKIFIAKKEAAETRYWLGLLKSITSSERVEIEILLTEVRQLVLIFQKIVNSTKRSELDITKV